MTTKRWIWLLSLIVIVCLGLSMWLLLPGEDASAVRVWSDGDLVYTLSLAQEQTVEVRSIQGRNVITIADGKVAVTAADCPDGYCMARGFCSSGAQIICLPNRLVIEFVGRQSMDAVAG